MIPRLPHPVQVLHAVGANALLGLVTVSLKLDARRKYLFRDLLVQPQRLLTVLGFVLPCGFCHQIKGFLEG